MEKYFNINNVAEAWGHGISAEGHKMWTDGESIFFDDTIIAWRKSNRTAVFNDTKYADDGLKKAQRAVFKYIRKFTNTILRSDILVGTRSFV